MAKNLHKQISDTVRRELKRKRWSVHKLWKETGLSRSSLYFMVDNTTDWSIEALLKVSEALKVSIYELLYNSDSEFERKITYELETVKQENEQLRDKISTYETVLNIDAIKKLKN